jgi:hypothetical protein
MSKELRDHRNSPPPDPIAIAYFQRADQEASAAAVATRRYVTVEYGDGSPRGHEGKIGITYAPDGSYVMGGSYRPEVIERIARLVALANKALDLEGGSGCAQ